tara:strand:+ start:613 stop:771 length:159 start_codon:yes stop_codon:yes gene_type:complete
MKVGDLVEFRGSRGLVLKIGEGAWGGSAFIAWFGLEPEWDSVTLLEVISASR